MEGEGSYSAKEWVCPFPRSAGVCCRAESREAFPVCRLSVYLSLLQSDVDESMLLSSTSVLTMSTPMMTCPLR